MSIEENIKKQIEDNKILLYMKGSPDKPQCGFSQRATQILMACGKEFSFVDILSNQDIRETLGWVIIRRQLNLQENVWKAGRKGSQSIQDLT